METVDTIIIGAGFAGAATSYFLHQQGHHNHVILEAAELPGTRSSGLNAAMGRQLIADPQARAAAMAGVQFLRNPPPGFSPTPLIDDRGSLMVFANDPKTFGQLAHTAHQEGLPLEVMSTAQAIPLIATAAGAIHCPTDGVIDIHALLYAYLAPARACGALYCNSPAEEIRRDGHDWIVTTPKAEWRATTIVNAAGAWAGKMGAMAGSTAANLRVTRRHLLTTAPSADLNPAWPFVWDLSHEYYFRPESGGLLVSICDEDEVSADAAYTTAPDIRERALQKLSLHCPKLSSHPVKNIWAGARTFAPEGRVRVGWDSTLEGFFWVAGLGGHGVTTSAAIGQRAASAILLNMPSTK